MRLPIVVFVALMLLFVSPFISPISAMARSLNELSAKDIQGETQKLFGATEVKALVVMAHGNSCPVLRKTFPRFEELAQKFSSRGVQFYYVNGSLQDDIDAIKKEHNEYGLKIPLLHDSDQSVLTTLGLRVTSEVVLIDAKTKRKIYQGALDDQERYEVSKKQAEHLYLERALEEFLQGKKVTLPRTRPLGCHITIRKSGG